MQALTAQIQIFHTLCGKWAKVNFFRNRVTQLHSYAVTQLHKV